jgi:hypothetical protein
MGLGALKAISTLRSHELASNPTERAALLAEGKKMLGSIFAPKPRTIDRAGAGSLPMPRRYLSHSLMV